jgi:hypothetical protein
LVFLSTATTIGAGLLHARSGTDIVDTAGGKTGGNRDAKTQESRQKNKDFHRKSP